MVVAVSSFTSKHLPIENVTEIVTSNIEDTSENSEMSDNTAMGSNLKDPAENQNADPGIVPVNGKSRHKIPPWRHKSATPLTRLIARPSWLNKA